MPVHCMHCLGITSPDRNVYMINAHTRDDTHIHVCIQTNNSLDTIIFKKNN